MLNVNGHDYEIGKAAEYKQKRCINQALHGMFALSTEWLGCGELDAPENRHQFGGHVDLTGANVAGLFYLAMRRGLDYLATLPGVDPQPPGGHRPFRRRLADHCAQRARSRACYVSVPVAGFSAMISKLEHGDDLGDNEQAAADFLDGFDYSTLAAMRAPRPTLLIHNAEDDCCFRAPLVKPYTYDQVRPFFALFGKEDVFAWHENTRSGHAQLPARQPAEAYAFLSRYLGVPEFDRETPVDDQVQQLRRAGRRPAQGQSHAGDAGAAVGRRASIASPRAATSCNPQCATSPLPWSTRGRWPIPKTAAWRRSPGSSSSTTS